MIGMDNEYLEKINKLGDAEICGLQSHAITAAGGVSAGVTT